MIRKQVTERANEDVEPLHVADEPNEQQMIRVARLVGTRRREDLLVYHVRYDVDWNRLAEQLQDALPKRFTDGRDTREAWQRAFDLATDGRVPIQPWTPHRVFGRHDRHSELRSNPARDHAFRIDEVRVNHVERGVAMQPNDRAPK